MAQRRMIDKKISVSEQVANLSVEGALLFTWMIPHADDAGLLPYSPRAIKALVVPMRDEMTAEIIGFQLESMCKQNLISPFHYEGITYWRINNFHQIQTLQKDRNPQTLFYFEKGKDIKANWDKLFEILKTDGLQLDSNSNTTVFHLDTEMKGKEVKGNETKVTGGGIPSPITPSQASPEVNKSGGTKDVQSIGALLTQRGEIKKPSVETGGTPKNSVSTSWQDKALRYAKSLKINLDVLPSDKRASYFKVFKQASEGRKSANLERAYTYLIDYPRPLSDDARLNYFFHLYENGLKAFGKNGQISIKTVILTCLMLTLSLSFSFVGKSAQPLIREAIVAGVPEPIGSKTVTHPAVSPTRPYVGSNHYTDPEVLKKDVRYVSKEFGINSEMLMCVLEHESGLQSRNKDGSLKCGDGGRSCGLGQIQLQTWQSIRKHAGWSTEDERDNDFENMRTTAYGLSTVWPLHWTGYHICYQLGFRL